MAKNKQQKQKERERRVAKQKLAEAARRREVNKSAKKADSAVPRARKVLTAGVQEKHGQVTSQKPTVTHRRTGG
ncbi:MAG: hypothetical protein R3C19_15810 [Planctomycetaceae bacterium]